MKTTDSFKHESLQDQKTIAQLLKAITNGLAKGKVTFEDEKGTMTMEPKDLLHFKVSADQDDGKNKINIRISWQEEQDIPKGKNLKIK